MKNDYLIKKLEKSLADDPFNIQARYELGRLYEEDGEYHAAVRELENVLRQKPAHIAALFELGIVYTRMKSYENAITTWQLLLDEDGDFTLDGVDYSRHATMMAVYSEWERYRNLNGEKIFHHYNLGFAFLVLGRIDEAALEFETILQINPRFEGANYYMALTWRKRGRALYMGEYLQRELEIRPQFAQGYYLLGLALLRQNNRAGAITNLQKALALKPRYVKANFHLGLIFAAQSQWDEALRFLQHAVDLRPGFHEAHFHIAQVYEKQYKMEEAIAAYQRSSEANPRYREAHFHLGLAYKTLGRLEAAVAEMKEAADLDPLDAEAHYYMGLCNYQLGNYEVAVENHESAVRVSPKHAFANYALGQAHLKLGHNQEAIDAYLRAIEQNPRDMQTHSALGVAYFQTGDFAAAAKQFEIVLEANPRDAESHYFLGAALFKMQDVDRAVDEYTRVASLQPNSPYAHFALGASHSRRGAYDIAIAEFEKAQQKMTATSEGDLALFSTLQLLALIGVEHAQKSSQLSLTLKELEDIYIKTIQALTNAIESRDKYTQFHSKRVSNIGEHFARFLKVPEKEIVAVRMGGYMHDLGKIGVPDFVLRKEGKLTDDERMIIELHPTLGAEILEGLNLPWHILPIVRCHHEKWDGTGYPDGLRGMDIPRNAQIVSVADFWDALSTARPYKPAYPAEKCIAIMKEQRGKHFDPDLVEMFIDDKFVEDLILL